MILSILICSLRSRQNSLATLLLSLTRQCEEIIDRIDEQRVFCELTKYIFPSIEILVVTDSQKISTGRKRNLLLSEARGKYVCFIDDDDSIHGDYVREILSAASMDCDCICFDGIMTTDGGNQKRWFISKDLEYKAVTLPTGEEVYHRYPNHLAVIKREIALQIQFPDQQIGEDYIFATNLKNSGLLKSEYKINKQLYHYQFRTNK